MIPKNDDTIPETIHGPDTIPGRVRPRLAAPARAVAPAWIALLALLAACGATAVGGEKKDGAGAAPEAAASAAEAGQADGKEEAKLETATFAAGCFWCVEAVYQRIEGVESVLSGYTGGTVENPSYDAVCSGRTGHAEAVQLRFDPEVVSYEKLASLFFELHDPTTLNRQGNDVGTQYRSAIFWHDEKQRETAEAVKKKYDESGKFRNPIVTEIAKFEKYWPAEEYHRDFYNRNPENRYCQAIIPAKLKKLGLDVKKK